jgi:hypothetical protein
MLNNINFIINKTWIFSEKEVNRQKKPAAYMIGKNESILKHDEIIPFNKVELQIYDIVFDQETSVVAPVLLMTESKSKPL